MQALLAHLVAHPVSDIAAVLSFCAALAFLIFLWGVLDYALARGNAQERLTGSAYMVWGVSLLIFLFLLWEIVRWIGGTT